MNKDLSEKYFIQVIYAFLLKDGMTMEDKEMISRIALALHKEYWSRMEG